MQELKACWEESNNHMSVVSVLVTLPAKYSMVITALETMDQDHLTMENKKGADNAKNDASVDDCRNYFIVANSLAMEI